MAEVFGNLILIRINFYDFISLFSFPLVLVSIVSININHTTLFDHIFKHDKVCV